MIETGEPSLGNDLKPNIKITESYMKDDSASNSPRKKIAFSRVIK